MTREQAVADYLRSVGAVLVEGVPPTATTRVTIALIESILDLSTSITQLQEEVSELKAEVYWLSNT